MNDQATVVGNDGYRFPLLLDEYVPRSVEQALRQHCRAAVRVVDLKEPTTRQVGRPL